MRYGEWLDVWLNNYIEPTTKSRTYELYEQLVGEHIKPVLGHYELDDIMPIDLQELITGLLKNGNVLNGCGLSVGTVNLIITIVQNSLRTAYITGVAKIYIADRIRRPKLKQKKVVCFTVPEQKKIEKAALNDKRSKMIGVVICLYTGLRIGELLALKWSDVDLRKETINVNKTCRDGKTNDGYGRIVDAPKTISSYRIIAIPKQLIRVLKKLKKRDKSEFVISSGGQPPTVRSYQQSFCLMLKDLGIPHKGFHSLRHTFATRALECGMDVKTLSEILGHRNATVTLNRYAHSMPEHKQLMMNRVGRLLSDNLDVNLLSDEDEKAFEKHKKTSSNNTLDEINPETETTDFSFTNILQVL